LGLFSRLPVQFSIIAFLNRNDRLTGQPANLTLRFRPQIGIFDLIAFHNFGGFAVSNLFSEVQYDYPIGDFKQLL
jgi:hypothetical protein